MIDYLQLMRVPALSDNRTLEIAEISRSLKALAKELNVPVVALSQLNWVLWNNVPTNARSTPTCVNLVLSSRMRT